MELEDTNAMVPDAFGEYLEKVKGLEPKSVRKHQGRVNTFIQTYLRKYVLTTPVDATDKFDIVEEY
jgi:hypothetical protein